MRVVVLPAVTAAMLLLTGCAGGGAAPERPVAELVADGVDCTLLPRVMAPSATAAPEPPRAGSVPEDFDPVEAVVCREPFDGDATVERDGQLFTALHEEHLAGDLSGLLDALSAPNDVGFGACTADMEIVPDLWLVDADGTAMRAAWPLDRCGKTKPATHDALAALESAGLVLVPNRPIDREAHESGCPETVSVPTQVHPVALVTEPIVPGETMPPTIPVEPAAPAPSADPPRACLYAVLPPEPQEPLPAPGLDEPLVGTVFLLEGTFLRAVELTGDQKAALRESWSGERVDSAECSATPTLAATFPPPATDDGFAVDSVLVAELDGCRRLFVAFQTAYAFPATLADALAVQAIP